MALVAFHKHAADGSNNGPVNPGGSATSLSGFSYKAYDHTPYTAGVTSGQRAAMYYPAGAEPAGGWPLLIYIQNSGFVSSEAAYSSALATSDQTITNTSTNIGWVWQALSGGNWLGPGGGVRPPCAVMMCQSTSALSTNDGASSVDSVTYTGTVPTGQGRVHAPGGIGASTATVPGIGYYESRARPSGYKDAVMAIQYMKQNAALFHINPGKIGMGGKSAGACYAAWAALAPNRKQELGRGGQYEQDTVPNVFIADRLVVGHWDYWQASIAAAHFPLGESGGAGTDDTAATNLGVAPLRYKRAFSLPGYLSDCYGPCIPYTFYFTDVVPATHIVSPPYLENSGLTGTSHSAVHALIFKALMGPRVRLALTTLAQTSGTGFDMSSLVDVTLADIDGAAAAGSTDGEAVDFLMKHIGDPLWDQAAIAAGGQGIERRGQVNCYGRCVVPSNGDRGAIEIVNAGPTALYWWMGPVGQINNAGVAPLATQIINGAGGQVPHVIARGQGPLWIAAVPTGGTPAQTVAVYRVREIPKGAI